MTLDSFGSFLLFVLIICIPVLAIGFALTAPHFEAQAFNQCTGGNAGYFTALFTELRVENCNR